MASRTLRPAKKKAAPSRPLGTIIAERRLTLVGDGRASLRIRVGKPRKDRATGDFFCPYSIDGLGDGQVGQAWGIDSMQALQNVHQAIRVELEPHAGTVQWEGGQEGWLGFPKVIPSLFGPEFTRHLEHLVERETDRFARNLERSSKLTAKRRKPHGAQR